MMHEDHSSHSKVFNLVTIYEILKSKYLFSQVVSPLLNKKMLHLSFSFSFFFFFFAEDSISYKMFLFLRLFCCFLETVEKKKEVIFQTPSSFVIVQGWKLL
jgi:hypothetical protein